MTNQKRLLLALDGSDRAFQTVRYVSEISNLKKMQVVLFTVFNKIPEYYWDLESQPHMGRRLRDIRVWEMQQEKDIKKHMEKARRHLLNAGFSGDAVSIAFHERTSGIARDIIKEARKGYDGVVIGRKGWTRIRNLTLGSVSSKLLQKVSFISLLLVGKGALPGKILIAMDASEGSKRTVDYVGAMLGGSGLEVMLLHVVRGNTKERIQDAQTTIVPVFDEAKSALTKAGFESEALNSKIITGAQSRAATLVQEAREGGYKTIFIGRRGMSKIREFFIGRVSNKVIQLAKGLAVWVVS